VRRTPAQLKAALLQCAVAIYIFNAATSGDVGAHGKWWRAIPTDDESAPGCLNFQYMDGSKIKNVRLSLCLCFRIVSACVNAASRVADCAEGLRWQPARLGLHLPAWSGTRPVIRAGVRHHDGAALSPLPPQSAASLRNAL
jgi:hypothetical protein